MTRAAFGVVAGIILAATLWFGCQAYNLASTPPPTTIHVCHEDCGVRDDGKICVADSGSPEGVTCYIK